MLIDRSIMLLQNAEREARHLKERAHALAPWLVSDAVADRRPGKSNERDGRGR